MVIIILSALQSFSGACLALMHAYKQAISTIKLVNQSPVYPVQDAVGSEPSHITEQSTPGEKDPDQVPSSTHVRSLSSATTASTTLRQESPSATAFSPIAHPQDYAVAPILMVSEIFSTRNRFSSTLFISTLSMASAAMTPFLDKLFPYLLQRFLSPAFILNITRLSKRTLFPNGYPGPPPIDPSPEEQAEIRARLVAWRPRGPICMCPPFSPAGSADE